MPAFALLSLVAIVAYLLGAIPFGYLIGRARGIDIRQHGSKNIGATNVGRVLGRWWGVLVFVLDFLKGALPVAVATWLPEPSDGPLSPNLVSVTAGLMAFLGHLFPVYLGFRGGKGVATGAGVIAVLVPVEAVLVITAWAMVLGATRLMSLASLTAAGLLPILRHLLTAHPWDSEHWIVTLVCLLCSAAVIVRHYANIRRLWQGTEHRL
jgi:acyl phosphate:glycerol-3-phosphate acyltransferase